MGAAIQSSAAQRRSTGPHAQLSVCFRLSVLDFTHPRHDALLVYGQGGEGTPSSAAPRLPTAL